MCFDKERIERIKKLMSKQGIDILVCSLPENVLYLSGYWPVMGNSTIIFPVDGEAVLLLPFEELDYSRDGWVTDNRTFNFTSLERLSQPVLDKVTLLQELWHEKGYGKAVAGYEGNFELIAGNIVSAEARVVTPNSLKAFMDAIPSARWIDATQLIKKARIIKSNFEIEQLKISNEVACMGLDTAKAMLSAGFTESEIAGAAEGAIYGRGVGYKNVKRARGYCFVMSGENSANSWRPFCVSSSKKLQVNEPVLVELDAVTNGYFIDTTRTFYVGQPDKRAKLIFDTVQNAILAAIEKVKPGIRAAEIDKTARNVVTKAGFGEYFPHQLGHGIGLQFHEPPAIHPASNDIVETGMVFAIEPAIYIPGFGGVRQEENLVVTENGCDVITPYAQRVEHLI